MAGAGLQVLETGWWKISAGNSFYLSSSRLQHLVCFHRSFTQISQSNSPSLPSTFSPPHFLFEVPSLIFLTRSTTSFGLKGLDCRMALPCFACCSFSRFMASQFRFYYKDGSLCDLYDGRFTVSNPGIPFSFRNAISYFDFSICCPDDALCLFLFHCFSLYCSSFYNAGYYLTLSWSWNKKMRRKTKKRLNETFDAWTRTYACSLSSVSSQC